MDDDYHNILSEEFPSPIRHHEPLPDLTLEAQQHDQHHANALAHNIQSIPDLHEPSSLHPSPHSPHAALEEHEREADEAMDAEFARHDREVMEDPSLQDHADAEDRRRGGVKHLQLTAEEKKERQKAQNRKAAERSRAKKREEVEALEVGVAQMGEENAKLRARLAELLAARSSVAPPEIASATPPPASAKPIESGVDYAYLSKIQSEIHTAKATLLERELELSRLRNDTPVKADASIDNLRRGLLKQYTKQTYLQAEATSLETMIGQIRTEKDELGKQTDLLNRDILHRKTYQIVEVPTEPPQSEAMEVDVGVGEMEEHGEIAHDHEHEEAIGDKSMMDIGGWVDAAWQASGHPVSVGIEKE